MTWASNRLKLWKQHRSEKRQKATKRIALALNQRREQLNRAGDLQSDCSKAEKIAKSSLRQVLFSINGTLISTEKRIVEPLSQQLKDSALFDIVDRLSPALEAIGVLLIPLVLYLATQSYEKQREAQANERLQQESVQNYIAQLSEILLNVEGDLRSPENRRIRTIATASTFTLLNDPILNGERKGQVIVFLSQMELVQGSKNTDEDLERGVIISLLHANLSGVDVSFANLSFANLGGANLNDAVLSGANLSFANLGGANLLSANLSHADLSGAVLSGADLNYADLSGASLGGADLNYADLNDANLYNANLRSADLTFADLSDAYLRDADMTFADLSDTQNWSDEQLGQAKLCRTILPYGSKLDPNHGCGVSP